MNGRFRVVPKGTDTNQIIADHSGKCLNVYQANDADNTPVHQYTCGPRCRAWSRPARPPRRAWAWRA